MYATLTWNRGVTSLTYIFISQHTSTINKTKRKTTHKPNWLPRYEIKSSWDQNQKHDHCLRQLLFLSTYLRKFSVNISQIDYQGMKSSKQTQQVIQAVDTHTYKHNLVIKRPTTVVHFVIVFMACWWRVATTTCWCCYILSAAAAVVWWAKRPQER